MQSDSGGAGSWGVCSWRWSWRLWGCRFAAQTPLVDPRVWTELDIVPMPKQIRLTDHDLPMVRDRVVLVVGRQPSRQSQIGAEWINHRLQALGDPTLAIVGEGKIPAGAVAFIIGTCQDNQLIDDAARAGVVNVGDDNPGKRGYEIRSSGEGRQIYLAGADPLGALYACVTLESFSRSVATLSCGVRPKSAIGPICSISAWEDSRSARRTSLKCARSSTLCVVTKDLRPSSAKPTFRPSAACTTAASLEGDKPLVFGNVGWGTVPADRRARGASRRNRVREGPRRGRLGIRGEAFCNPKKTAPGPCRPGPSARPLSGMDSLLVDGRVPQPDCRAVGGLDQTHGLYGRWIPRYRHRRFR